MDMVYKIGELLNGLFIRIDILNDKICVIWNKKEKKIWEDLCDFSRVMNKIIFFLYCFNNFKIVCFGEELVKEIFKIIGDFC